MPRFLLTTQSFVDLARAASSELRKWLAKAHEQRGVTDLDLAVSTMSLSTLERYFHELEREGKLDAKKMALKERCKCLALEFGHRGSILPVQHDELDSWIRIYKLNLEFDYEDRFIFATAATRELTLVDRHHPEHEQLRQLGLSIEVPQI